jgi:hypothetical protein
MVSSIIIDLYFFAIKFTILSLDGNCTAMQSGLVDVVHEQDKGAPLLSLYFNITNINLLH